MTVRCERIGRQCYFRLMLVYFIGPLDEIMMPRYYVNKNAQPNGVHEVHATGCAYMPDEQERVCLGNFHGSEGLHSCHFAIKEAGKHYSQVNGCYYCASECYKP